MVWYTLIDGAQLGPFSNSDLKAIAASGRLKPDDHVWKEGLSEWVLASRIKGLFPPTPPPAPKSMPPAAAAPSFVWPEPSLGEVVIRDDDASEAWKNREPSPKGNLGLLSIIFKQSIQEAVFNHRQRLLRRFANGKEIPLVEVLDRLEKTYSSRGFKVRRFVSTLIVVKRSSGTSTKIDTYPSALAGVGTLTNGFIRVSEESDSWVVSLTAEAFFWPMITQPFLDMAGIFCVAFLALLLFWPCLCLIPFLLTNIDIGEARAALQEDVTTPVEKLAIEFV